MSEQAVSISISCTQRFDVEITHELVALLTKLGETHYDGVCKDAVKVRGFIYGWSNMLYGRPGPVFDGITNRQLQTCLKILENPLPLGTVSEVNLRAAFSRLGFSALRQANADPRFSSAIKVDASS